MSRGKRYQRKRLVLAVCTRCSLAVKMSGCWKPSWELELWGSAGRRRRSAEERRLIVEVSLVRGVSVVRAAQKHGINANQVFQWHRLYRDDHLGAPPRSGMKLLAGHPG